MPQDLSRLNSKYRGLPPFLCPFLTLFNVLVYAFSRKAMIIPRYLTALGLIFFLQGFSHPQTREVTIKLVADEEFRKDTHWREKAKSFLERARSDFEAWFGIRLCLQKYDVWTSDSALHSLDLLAGNLEATVGKDSCDLLLAFIGQRDPQENYDGYSLFKEGTILLLVSRDKEAVEHTAHHELAHVFGAVHVNDRNSLMDIFRRGDRFDPLNAEIILLNKDRSFNSTGLPTPRANRERAAELYRTILDLSQASIALREREREETLPGRFKGQYAFWEEVFLYNLDDIHNLLAQIHLESGRYDEALEECEKALAINPESQPINDLIGIVLRRAGQLDRAIEKYRAILEVNPKSAKTLYNLGIAYSKKGNLEDALAAYQEALRLNPNYAEARVNIGEVYLRQSKVEEAEIELNKAVAINPRLGLAHANLAEAYFRKGEFEKSLAKIQSALYLNPGLPEAWNALGNLYYKERKLDDASREYRKALDLEPAFEKAHYNLGNCYFEQKLTREAKQCFERALELDPNFPEAHVGLGFCLLGERKWDEAAAEISTAHGLGFESSKTHLSLSWVALRKGKLEDAMAEAQKAVVLDPTNASAYYSIAIIHFRREEYSLAQDYLDRAVANGFCVPSAFLEQLGKKLAK